MASRRIGLMGELNALSCKGASALKQAIARRGTSLTDNQRFVDQCAQMIKHRPRIKVVTCADLLRGIEPKAAGKNT